MFWILSQKMDTLNMFIELNTYIIIMSNGRFLLFLGGLLFLISCSPQLSPFTQALYDDFNWSEDELKQIQFYLSEDIVLVRELRAGESRISGGKIRIVDGNKIEEVVIRAGTPGILLFTPKENRFAISFEESDNDKFLMFGPNPKLGDKYVLLAKDWNKRRGRIHYGGKIFETTADNALATLLVDLKQFKETSVKSRTASGRTIN